MCFMARGRASARLGRAQSPSRKGVTVLSHSGCDKPSAAGMVMAALEGIRSFPLIVENASIWVGYQGHFVHLVGLDEMVRSSLFENLDPMFEITTSAPSPSIAYPVIFCRAYVPSTLVDTALAQGERCVVVWSAMCELHRTGPKTHRPLIPRTLVEISQHAMDQPRTAARPMPSLGHIKALSRG